jgi:hypothetical protein
LYIIIRSFYVMHYSLFTFCIFYQGVTFVTTLCMYSQCYPRSLRDTHAGSAANILPHSPLHRFYYLKAILCARRHGHLLHCNYLTSYCANHSSHYQQKTTKVWQKSYNSLWPTGTPLNVFNQIVLTYCAQPYVYVLTPNFTPDLNPYIIWPRTLYRRQTQCAQGVRQSESLAYWAVGPGNPCNAEQERSWIEEPCIQRHTFVRTDSAVCAYRVLF